MAAQAMALPFLPLALSRWQNVPVHCPLGTMPSQKASFILKTELVHHQRYQTGAEAKQDIFE
jgi:hypothetical protein